MTLTASTPGRTTAAGVPSRTSCTPALLEQRLGDAGCDALMVVAESSRDPDLAPFVGPAHLGRCVWLAPRDGSPRLAYWNPMERQEAAATGIELLEPPELELPRLSRELTDPALLWAAVLRATLEGVELQPGRVALAGRPRVGEIHAACRILEAEGWRFVDGHDLVRQLRKRKRPAEVEEIHRTAAAVRAALRRLAELLAAAVTRPEGLELGGESLRVARLRSEVSSVLASFGLEQPEGNLLAVGEEGSVPHNPGTSQKVLRPGESLVVDLFPRGRLFADCTRTFCVGPPPPALLKAHQAVREALEEAHRRVCPGVRGWSLQEVVCGLFARRGYPNPVTHPGTLVGYVHSLGHGVGAELHEYPSFSEAAGAEGVLEEGDVFTLEPGLYDPEAGWGVRLEDLVHLGAEGAENLTPLPYALDPREWVMETPRAG